jgi:hypothetical protein
MKFVLYMFVFIATYLFKLYKIWIWLNSKRRVNKNREITDKHFIFFSKVLVWPSHSIYDFYFLAAITFQLGPFFSFELVMLHVRLVSHPAVFFNRCSIRYFFLNWSIYLLQLVFFLTNRDIYWCIRGMKPNPTITSKRGISMT